MIINSTNVFSELYIWNIRFLRFELSRLDCMRIDETQYYDRVECGKGTYLQQ